MKARSGRVTIPALYAANRFLVLVLLLVAFIVLSGMFESSEHRLLLRTVLVTFVLLAAMGCVEFGGRWASVSRWLGIVTLLSGWVTISGDSPALMVVSAAFRITFFVTVAIALIYQIATSSTVTGGTILGSIAGYLLLGIIGAAAFSIVETVSPGSLRPAGEQLLNSDHMYYAFVTMSTVGYGDIVPVAPGARALAILLAVAGQLYLAVLIALLVGKYLTAKG